MLTFKLFLLKPGRGKTEILELLSDHLPNYNLQKPAVARKKSLKNVRKFIKLINARKKGWMSGVRNNSFCGETFAVFHFQVWWNFHAVVACNVVNHFQPVDEVFLLERLASEVKKNRIKDFLDPWSWLSRIFFVLLFEACHRWRGRAPNVSWTPTLPPLNTETQRIELTCFYRKLWLKTIYNSDGERDRLLISGTTTVGSNNNHTVNYRLFRCCTNASFKMEVAGVF